MEFVELRDYDLYKFFINWHCENVEDLGFEPAPIADRVNYKDSNGNVLAFKTYGLVDGEPVDFYYIREDAWQNFNATV
jgi:hypothetical protein